MVSGTNSNLHLSFYQKKLVKEHVEELSRQQQAGLADCDEQGGKLLHFYDQ
jgi:hypothetical protein